MATTLWNASRLAARWLYLINLRVVVAHILRDDTVTAERDPLNKFVEALAFVVTVLITSRRSRSERYRNRKIDGVATNVLRIAVTCRVQPSYRDRSRDRRS